jgi:DNA-binding transcriptional ArsR family regulator
MTSLFKLQQFLQTLAEASRLKIIKFIGVGACTVSEIVEATGFSQPLVSHHLRILREGQLVETKRQGPFVYYNLRDTRILEVLGMLESIIEPLAERGKEAPLFGCPSWFKRKWPG